MAARIMILNGPNLNFLGIREPQIYGSTTLKEIEASCQELARDLGISISFHQSNLEGELVNLIQSAHNSADAIIMNPAATGIRSRRAPLQPSFAVSAHTDTSPPSWRPCKGWGSFRIRCRRR